MNQDDFNSIDLLLKKALSSAHSPDEELNHKIINATKERMDMNKNYKKPALRVVLIAAIIAIATSVSAFAIWNLLKADQLADNMGYPALAEAFRSKEAVKVNKSVTAGDYKITFIGITSGKGLTGMPQDTNISLEKDYAVVAVEKLKGKMQKIHDDTPFFISPLIKGQIPWQVNIASMGDGGYGETVIDGVLYRLVECNSIEMFADKGAYLAVCSSMFYETKAFVYDFDSGEVTPNPNYKGVNILFELPLDKAKADPVKARQLLDKIYGDFSKFQREELPGIRKEYTKFIKEELSKNTK